MTTGRIRSCTSADGVEDARTRRLEAYAEARVHLPPVRFNGALVEVTTIVKFDLYADADAGSHADVSADSGPPLEE